MTHRWNRALLPCRAVAAGVAAALMLLIPADLAAAQSPSLKFDADGPAELTWNGLNILGDRGFAVERVVLEKRADPTGPLWGHSFTAGAVDSPKTTVDAATGRVTHQYPWGRAELKLQAQGNRIEATVTLENALKDQAIADFSIRLLNLAFFEPQGAYRQGVVKMNLDRPLWHTVPLPEGRLLITCDSFDVPVQFGIGRDLGANKADRSDRREHRYDLVVLGGVPSMKADQPVMPLLGLPRVEPGRKLTLEFTLRFATAEQSDTAILQPYIQGYRQAQGRAVDWPDRRPIAKLVIPSAPTHMTPANPRGWFKAAEMDLRTEAGRAAFNEKLAALADRAIEQAKAAKAQGVVVWNIEGSHVLPAQPMGEPRLLEQIAPEMDAAADAFFKRFADAGLRTGITIRPSQLYYSDWRQRWTQGTGSLGPEPEPFIEQYKKLIPEGQSPQRVYPLAQRLSDKITYAKKRWGCTIFYIHFNGGWWRMAPDRHEQWMLMDARILQQVRRDHPDVLLVPQYSERHWRSARTPALRRDREKRPEQLYPELQERDDVDIPIPPAKPRVSLRGMDEDRIGGASTPDWVVIDAFRLDRDRAVDLKHCLPDRHEHVLRESYWHSAAPYVELQQEKLIRAYILTLEQHMEYTEEQAQAMAEATIAFQTTPAAVRDWMPTAFTTIDITGAEVDRRRSQLEQAVAWGDVLMWPADQSPVAVRNIIEAVRSKQQQMVNLTEHLGLPKVGKADLLPPLSLTWARGQTVAPEQLVVARDMPEALRTRVLYSPDRRNALVMFAWRGGAGGPAQLLAELPGVDLATPHKQVWLMPTGASPPANLPMSITPDPVGGLTAILVHGSDKPVTAPPPGVLLAASFDDGVTADMGGGPPLAAQPDDAARDSGRSGQALVLGSGQSVGYGVVPDWFGGTAEFDLNARQAGDQPLTLMRFRHHLDAELALVQRKGRAGLLLTTREQPPESQVQADAGAGGDTAAQPLVREAFAPLPGGTGNWRRIALTWQLGQYHLYIDGKPAAQITGATALQRPGAAVLEAGVVLGQADKAPGQALIDSLIVYDWPMRAEQVAGRQRIASIKPMTPPTRRTVEVWAWGKLPEKTRIAVDARGLPRLAQVDAFEVRLYRTDKVGRTLLGTTRLSPYGGVAMGDVPYKPARQKDFEAIKPEVQFGGDDDDGFSLAGDDLGLETKYELEIQPLPEGSGPPPRKIEFSAGKGTQALRW